MSNKFKYKDDALSEEHIKQLFIFLNMPYVKDKFQKWLKFATFKWLHKREMDTRDANLNIIINKG